MKKVIKVTLLVAFLVGLLAISCKKGDTGPAGTPGTNGTNGSTILSGNGAPSASLGTVGDFYLDLSALMFYGPKTSGGWGTGVSIRGAQGNANVITDTFTVTNAQWGYATEWYTTLSGSISSGDSAKYCNRNEPHLTQDIIDKGMVIGSFISEPVLQPASWNPLPFSYLMSNTGYSVNYAFLPELNVIHLYFFFQTTAGAKAPVLKYSTTPTLRFKFVFIAGQIGTQIRDAVRQGKTVQLQ